MRHVPLFVRAGLCTLLAAAVLVAPLPGSTPVAVADEAIELTFAEEMPMEDFLRTVAKLTGQTLVWNPLDKNIRGKKIIGGVSLKARPSEFLSLARGVLTFYELVLIPVGPQGYEILLVVDARQSSVLLKLKPKHIVLTDENLASFEHMDGLYVTTSIHVEHMRDLRNARNALTRIVTGQNIGNVTEVPDAKAFVVTDFAPNVVAIYRLLKKMDHPSAASSTTSGESVAVTLEHAEAVIAAEILLRHFMPDAGPAPTRGPSQAAKGPSAPRIVGDARTNRLLISGTSAEIEKVRAAILLIDIQIARPEVSAHMIRLEHIRASEAYNAIFSLIRGSPTLWRGAGRNAPTPTVVNHNETNSLLVSGTAEAVRSIRELVAQMDIKTK